MAGTISNLQEVRDWLQTINTGTSVTVGSSMFNAEMVTKLLTMAPGLDDLQVSVSAVNSSGDKPSLTGTATVLEQANTTAVFTFSQPHDLLLCSLDITLDPSVEWRLIQSFKLWFTQLNASFAPDEELKTISLTFACTMKAGETKPLHIPVSFSMPSFDGDWTLTGSFSQVGDLSEEILEALGGNNNIVSILPEKVVEKMNAFSLKTVQVSFNPLKQTCSFIRIVLGYDADWRFFNDMFVVEGLEFDFEVFNPLTQDTYYQALLVARMNLFTGFPFEIGGQFPDKVLFANLQHGQSANINQVFSFLQIPMPDNFPVVEISQLSLIYYTALGGYDFRLGITKPIPIAGSVVLNNAFFEMGANYNDATKKMEGFGNINVQFNIGQTTLLLGARYAADKGIDFEGEIKNLPIGDLIADLISKFGVEKESIPGFISGIKITNLKVTYNTTSGNFSFNCTGTIPVADNEKLTIDVKLTAVKSGTNYDKKIHAEGKVTYKENTFRLVFDKTTSATAFAAQWEKKGTLGIKDIAGMLGIENEVPDIPEELDLGLQGAGFIYESAGAQPSFVLNASSANYGNAVFAATKNANKKWIFYFGLSTDRRIDLSNLPIIDKISSLIPQANLAVEAIHVDIASDTISKENSETIDKLIKQYTDPQVKYPLVPTAGMQNKVGFSMQVDIGGTKFPVSLGAGGSSMQALPAPGDNTSVVLVEEMPEAGGEKTFWFNLQKNFGPLFFDKIGLAYKDKKIFVLVNVSATAGGLTISLDGFGVSLPIKDFNISFALSGIGITFQSGPVLLSGGMIGSFSPKVDLVGQVLIKTSAISIGAIGGYTEVEERPSLFIFAVLNYPIGGPPYFFVTGLAAGFGYNRSLVLPDIGGVAEFPFVQWAMGQNNPPVVNPNGNVGKQVNTVLQTIIDTGVVAPSVGSNWLAAGIRFTSFEILDSFALLTVAFGTEFEVALLGLSRIVLPPAATKAGAKVPVVAYAELALKASYSQRTGLIGIQGQLTNNSYILSTKCHLTGGFAFYIWVSGPHLGDFVVTLGGYNSNYSPPSHYPVVPRLGMNWQVTDQLVIKGGLYCALTSNAVMAGGYMEAVWNSGSIKAWFSVQSDFLIMWKPFHYDISASVSIGASFSVDLWFTTLSMTIHVGAYLHIWGPEFTGEATVDLDIISFTIRFGAGDTNKPKTILWSDFATNMLPQKPAPKKRLMENAAEAEDVPNPDVCKLVVAGGLIKELSDKDNELNWIVNGETFELSTISIIPSKDWAFSNNVSLDPDAPANKAKQNEDFGIRPTGTTANALSSKHKITIASKENSLFHAVKSLGKVAKGLWQKIEFDKNGNPILGNPVKDTTLDNVLTGFSLVPFSPDARHTLPIKIENLQYEKDPNLQYYIWSNPYVPTNDAFDGQTVQKSIMSDRAQKNRNLLVQAMTGFNLSLNTNIDVQVLADPVTEYLLAEPVMRLLGEEKNN